VPPALKNEEARASVPQWNRRLCVTKIVLLGYYNILQEGY